MRHKLALLADGSFTPEALRLLISIQHEMTEQVAKSKSQQLTALEAADREERIGDWFEDHDIPGAWDYAPTFVEAGLDTDWLERISASVEEVDASASLHGALGWLNYTIDTVPRMNEIADASRRISALLAGAKQYSQMDRAPFQRSDVHELLRSTIKTLFGDKIGNDKPIKLVKEVDKLLPQIACYPADLNGVRSNIIHNAIQSIDEHGTLTLHTARVYDNMIRVEIGDDGPGIPGRHHGPHLHSVLHHQGLRRRNRGSVWTLPTGSLSKSMTVTSAWSLCPGTPASSFFCRWRHPHRRHPHQQSLGLRRTNPEWGRAAGWRSYD